MRVILFVFIFFSFYCFSLEQATIALVYDGKSVRNDPIVQKIKKEIEALLEDEYVVEFESFYGDYTYLGAQETIKEAFESDADVIVSLGFLTSMVSLEIKQLPKPIVMSYDIQIYEENPGKSLHSNKLAYFQGKKTFFSQIQQFMELTHSRRIGIVSDPSFLIPSKAKNLLVDAIENKGGEAIFLPVSNNVEKVLQTIETQNIQGLILLPTPRVSQKNFDFMIDAFKIPSFSFIGESEVDEGVLMSMTPETEKLRLSRRIALNVQELLLSNDNTQVVVDFFRTSEIILNQRVMNKLALDFSWDILAEAKIVDKVPIPKSKILNLKQSVEIAVKNNLNLDAEKNVVKSGYETVKVAQAPLLPQASISASNIVADRNTALYARGLLPQNSTQGNIKIQQLLYDERLLSGFEIEKYLQNSREYDKDRVELNVVLFAAVFYVDVLKIEKEKEIAQENIDLSKANLRRAYELVESGEKRKSEIYRWESELSRNKDNLAEVTARLENRKADFNQVLNRPIPEKVYLENISLFQPVFFEKVMNLMSYTKTPLEFDRFKELLIGMARKRIPEIKVFEERVLAQKRRLKAAKREFVLPSVFAFADLNKILTKQGAGGRPPDDLVSNTALSTQVGVTLSYPISTGGGRIAEKNRAFFDLKTTEIRKDVVIQRADVRVVQALDQLKASYDQIFFSKKAKEAAEKNLTIVTNSYSRGLVSIVDLLDAQNNTIVSRLSYYNALYDFIIDYLVLQRAVGDFDGFIMNRRTELDETLSLFTGASECD